MVFSLSILYPCVRWPMRAALIPCRRWRIYGEVAVLVLASLVTDELVEAQAARPPVARPSDTDSSDSQVATDLQIGITLTREGRFRDAIPHLLAAKQQGDRSFAAEFDLALCYAGTAQYRAAIEALKELEAKNPKNVNVYSLLSQVYVWRNRIPEALAVLKKAVELAPKNEKLYLLLDDACMERGQYTVGLDVANLGLKSLPNSPGLLYQRGMFLTLLDQFDTGRLDLARAAELGHGSEVGFLAAAQKASFEGNMPEVIRATRDGTKKHESEALLTMLGVALVRLGASPGQAEFGEAQTALERAVRLRPDVATSRIALGKIYLVSARTDDAIVQLEAARQLDSSIAAIYSNLARAYQQRGDQTKAQQMLSELSSLNQEQAETIRSAPGERRSSYLGSRSGQSQPHPSSPSPVDGEKHE